MKNAIAKIVALSLAILVVAVALCSVYIAVKQSTTNRISISSTVTPMNRSPVGLNLEVAISNSNLKKGHSLNITIELYNSLSIISNVSTNNNFTSTEEEFAGFPIAIWPPCMLPQPVNFMIVRGSYTLLQMEALSENSSWPSVFCPESGSFSTISFQPNSSIADLVDSCTMVCNTTKIDSVDLSSNFSVGGYWSYPFNDSELQDLNTPVRGCTSTSVSSCGLTFNYPEVGPIAQANFTSGDYTLAVADEWNQSCVLHFSVSD
jgi:hypothetical protein